MLTSFALSHSPSAFTIGLYPPNFFAARVSKPLESCSVSTLCSVVIARARSRSARGIDSGDAALTVLVSCYEDAHTIMLTSTFKANTAP
jgi:hypothetical protein